MKKSKLLIVGAFPPKNKDIYGGILKSCNIISKSEIYNKFEVITIDSCQISNPPPIFLIRSILAIKRIIILLFKLISNKPHVALIFSSDGASAIEKGFMILMCNYFRCKTLIFPRAGKLINQVENSQLMFKIISFLYSKSSMFLCQGKKWEQFALKVLKINSNKVKIINNWTATKELIKIGKHRNYNKKNKSYKLLFVGWVEKDKGVFDLIQTLNNLDKKGKNLNLTFVGDGTAKNSLIKYVNKNKLKNVNFLGWLRDDELNKVYAYHDIFVFPSWYEGMPNVVIEAMASGMAIVSSSAGVISDHLINGEHALLSNPKEKNIFQKNLEKIISNENLMKKIALNGHRLAKSKFSSDEGISQLVTIFNRLIQPS